MTFRLRTDEALPEGLKRCAAEQVDTAIAHLTGPDPDRQTAIHETRKSLKRIRALLRLIRPALGSGYKVEDAKLKEISGLLSPYRDADAMLELLETLRETQPELLDQDMYAQAHDALLGRRDTQLHADQGYPAVAREAVERLRAARRGIKDWELPAELDSMKETLKATFKRARKAGKRVADSNDVEDYHSWRKRVKALLYQGQLVKKTRLGPPGSYRKALDELAELLGEHHDLSVFEQLLGQPEVFPDRSHAAQVLKLVRQRRCVLEERTREVGRRLFSVKPKHFFDAATK
jgi:CHAD domain-containing protein